MTINRTFFFAHARQVLFDGALKPPQVVGISAILDKWEADMPNSDDRYLAYMLGTAHHETGRTMQPVRETFASSDVQAIARLNAAFKSGKLTWVKHPYWMPDVNGKSWLGRGLVQITHQANYQKLQTLTGIDITTDPNQAMVLSTAVAIMFQGMLTGAFTGKKLQDFFDGPKEKWREARSIINGLERADLVASYARQYYASISYTV